MPIMNTTSTVPLMPTADPCPQPYAVVRFNALKHGMLRELLER